MIGIIWIVQSMYVVEPVVEAYLQPVLIEQLFSGVGRRDLLLFPLHTSALSLSLSIYISPVIWGKTKNMYADPVYEKRIIN